MQTLCLMLLFACAGPWLVGAVAQPATSSTTKARRGQNAAEDINGTLHQMAEEKRRFQTAQQHVENGLKMRAQGRLSESLIEFQNAYATDPASPIAAQEIGITLQMIQRERQRVVQTGKEAAPEQRALTPAEEARKKMQDRISRLSPVPHSEPENPQPTSQDSVRDASQSRGRVRRLPGDQRVMGSRISSTIAQYVHRGL